MSSLRVDLCPLFLSSDTKRSSFLSIPKMNFVHFLTEEERQAAAIAQAKAAAIKAAGGYVDVDKVSPGNGIAPGQPVANTSRGQLQFSNSSNSPADDQSMETGDGLGGDILKNQEDGAKASKLAERKAAR